MLRTRPMAKIAPMFLSGFFAAVMVFSGVGTIFNALAGSSMRLAAAPIVEIFAGLAGGAAAAVAFGRTNKSDNS